MSRTPSDNRSPHSASDRGPKGAGRSPKRRAAPIRTRGQAPSNAAAAAGKLTKRNRRLNYALLAAMVALCYQGWQYATARLDQRLLVQQRTAVLRSLENKQREFMRLHNRYAGSVKALNLPSSTSSGITRRVLSFSSADGPVFIAEACNDGGCSLVDNEGIERHAVTLRDTSLTDADPVDLTEAPDPDQVYEDPIDPTPDVIDWRDR